MNGDAESWGWLLDPRLAGKVALVADPTIGAAEAALAIMAQGLAQFDDPADLSIAEIDTMVRILIQRKKAGHFHTLWQSVSDIVPLMEAGTVVLGSLWASALWPISGRVAWMCGTPCRWRAIAAGMAAWRLSVRTEGRALDAAYDYLNWWLSGWAGAQMTRYGLYVSASDNVRTHLSEAEWSFWYEGKPASAALPGPDGSLVISPRARCGAAARCWTASPASRCGTPRCGSTTISSGAGTSSWRVDTHRLSSCAALCRASTRCGLRDAVGGAPRG